MTTKARTELTLFDMLSRLTFARAARLLGPDSSRLIAAGGKHDIDIGAQVEFDKERFRLAIDSTTVTLALNSAARDRLEWRCSTCDAPCEHVGAAFSLILEEKLALGLADAPPEPVPIERLSEQALVVRALEERAERPRTEKMRLTSADPQEIWTDYTLTNAASGKSYRVDAAWLAAGRFILRFPDSVRGRPYRRRGIRHAPCLRQGPGTPRAPASPAR